MNFNRPRVCIGMPVYNAERYLEEALDSILAQTYADFTLVIVDNASTDRTPEICKAYVANDSRIQYYRNERNLGAAPNFNRTFTLSTGIYFKWAAHDDLIAPEFLERCVEVLDHDPNVVLCYPRVKMIDEYGQSIGDYDPLPDTSSSRPHERFRNLVLAPDLAVQQMGLIRRSALEKTMLHGSYPSSDEVLLAELALCGRFYELPERLLIFRYHTGQIARTTKQRERVAFYDTSRGNKISLPKWDYLRGCLRAINSSPVGLKTKAYCLRYVLRWTMVPAHMRALGKDVILAVAKIGKSSYPLKRQSHMTKIQ